MVQAAAASHDSEPASGRQVASRDRRVATVALLGATAIWGSTFVVTKESFAGMTPAAFLAWRFGLAGLVLVLAGHRSVAGLGAADRRRAVLLGVLLATGFLLQTTGLQHTLAGVSGFLTGASVVLTPVVAALWFRADVGRTGWFAVGVCALGIAGLSGGVTGASWVGAVLTLGGALAFAGHIAGLSQWATTGNALGLTAGSVAVAAVLCAAAAVVGGGLGPPPDGTAWRALVYLALAATCLGFLVQAWAQSALSATTAAVVMTSEPLFAALLARALGEQGLGATGWLGGVLVVSGMFVAELGPRRCCDARSPRVECC